VILLVLCNLEANTHFICNGIPTICSVLHKCHVYRTVGGIHFYLKLWLFLCSLTPIFFLILFQLEGSTLYNLGSWMTVPTYDSNVIDVGYIYIRFIIIFNFNLFWGFCNLGFTSYQGPLSTEYIITINCWFCLKYACVHFLRLNVVWKKVLLPYITVRINIQLYLNSEK